MPNPFIFMASAVRIVDFLEYFAAFQVLEKTRFASSEHISYMLPYVQLTRRNSQSGRRYGYIL